MGRSLHHADATLAALSDAEVERGWRLALRSRETALVVAHARQLVLRKLPLIEQTVELHARATSLRRHDCERIVEETSIKLFLRLLHDDSWRSLSGLAASTAQ